jgi:hypothetical protein
MVVEALCTVWLLTATCADDWILWNPIPGEHVSVTWNGQTVTTSLAGVFIGCWEGTMRILSDQPDAEPVFFYWDADPGRRMEWEAAGLPKMGCK